LLRLAVLTQCQNSYKTIIIVVIPTNIGILCSSIVYIFVCLFVCLLVARYLKQLDVGDRGYRGGSPTAVRPSDPALCGSCLL